MSILPILIYPNDILTSRAADVQTITADIKQLAADMQASMMAARGVGLAANQVGALHRVILINAAYCAEVDGQDASKFNDVEVMINPEITILDETPIAQREGCLSVPHVFMDVERPRSIEVTYLDLAGKTQKIQAEDGLLCAAIQHEVDHLDGIMFPDKLSGFQRRRAWQKLNKERANLAETVSYPIKAT